MTFTIIICTYNRSDLLRLTLPYYDEIDIPIDVNLEIIVVDNNSQDDTADYVQKFIKTKKSNVSYSYVFEPNQGLSHARNTGYDHSNGDYIAYTDDECILPKEWLGIAVNQIKESSPAFLGGPYLGKYLPNSSSQWFKETFGDSYILQYKLPDGPMQNRYLSGGNLIIRNDVFDKIGLFNTSLGMNGEDTGYGEEKDFQIRLKEKYPEEIIFYDSKLFVWHFIRNEKMSLTHLFKDALSRGKSAAEMSKGTFLKLLISPFEFIFSIFRALFSSIRHFIKSLFVKEHFFTLLHQDYASNIWRSIGGSWFRTTVLFKLPFKAKP